MGFKILVTLAIACLAFETASASVIACYHGSWSVYRSGDGNFGVSNIDPTLCTHLIYTFVGINSTDSSVILLDSYLEVDRGNLAAFVALKSQNPKLKVLIAVGGYNQGSINYSNMAASASLRANFISSALSIVTTYGFDGFDLDWEYPALRGGAAADKENFVTLIKEFREAFDSYSTENNVDPLLLTAAVSASESSVDSSYNVPGLSAYLDYIFVMAYDLHGSWDSVTGQNAPLYASSLSTASSSIALNVATCINGWLSRGAAAEKLVLGLPVYGRTFTLTSSSDNGLGAAASGAGTAGPYTQEAGILGYNEICEYQLAGGWTEVWDDEQKVPYMYKDNQWISYDNPASIKLKVEFAKSLNLAGVMTWSIETDDFHAKCGTKFAILTAINNATGSTTTDDDSDDTADDTNTDDTAADTAADDESDTDDTNSETTNDESDSEDTASSSSTITCTASGTLIADPENCSKFYQCISAGDGTYTAVQLSCSDGLYYDSSLQACNWASAVTCSSSS